jgi:hypothetical protein
MREILAKKFPSALLSAYFIKVLAMHPTLVDAGILLVLATLVGFFEAWSHKADMKLLRDELQRLNDRLDKADKTDQELRTYVTSLKMGQQVRGGLGGR